MAYIPVKHQKYDILPLCHENGGEVFSYSPELENKIDKFLPDGESIIPYGYESYEEYEKKINTYILKYGKSGENLSMLGETA